MGRTGESRTEREHCGTRVVLVDQRVELRAGDVRVPQQDLRNADVPARRLEDFRAEVVPQLVGVPVDPDAACLCSCRRPYRSAVRAARFLLT
jgi:hypothetical protein